MRFLFCALLICGLFLSVVYGGDNDPDWYDFTEV